MMNEACVYDFDCTLTIINLYNLLNIPDNFFLYFNLTFQNQLPYHQLKYHLSQYKKKYEANDIKIYNQLLIDDLPCDIRDISSSIINLVFGNERFQQIVNLLKTVKNKGAHNYISTKGFLKDVIIVLKLTNLLPYFNGLHGMMDGMIYVKNKGFIKKNVKKSEFILDLFQSHQLIIYADDSLEFHDILKNDPRFVMNKKNDQYEKYVFGDKIYYFIGLPTYPPNCVGLQQNHIQTIISLLDVTRGIYYKYLRQKKKYLNLKKIRIM